LQTAQQQHKDELVAGKPCHGSDGKAAQTGGHAGASILKTQESMPGKTDHKGHTKSERIGQLGPHAVLGQRKDAHMGCRSSAANRQKPECGWAHW